MSKSKNKPKENCKATIYIPRKSRETATKHSHKNSNTHRIVKINSGLKLTVRNLPNTPEKLEY